METVYYITASTMTFYSLNHVGGLMMPSVVNSSQLWRWRNIFVSFLHSFLTGIMSLYAFYDMPNMASDLIGTHSVLAHMLLAVSTGYFIYDTGDMLRSQTRQSAELIFHHAVVISCFLIALCCEQYISFLTLALAVEVNNIFLHLRQLLQLCGFERSSRTYRINSYINIATLCVFRLSILCWLARWVVQHKHDMLSFHYCMAVMSLFVLIAMSAVLFCRLVLSDFFSTRRSATATAQHKSAMTQPAEAVSAAVGTSDSICSELMSKAASTTNDSACCDEHTKTQ